MDIVEELTSAIKILDQLDEYKESLPNQLSEVDSRLSDLYHLIECNNLNAPQCCRVIKEIKKQRKNRRKIKNDISIISAYSNNSNRLNNIDNRKFVLSDVHKAEKKLGKNYTNKVYSDEELEKIVG